MYQLYRGECIEVMRDKVPNQSVHLILSDPPYGTTSCKWDTVIPFDQMWEQYRRILAPGGCVVLFGNHPFTSALVMSNPKWFKQALVWNKGKCGSPGLAKIRPMQVHEDILVFAPGRTTYNPIMEEGKPYARKSSNPEGYVGKHNRHGYGMKPRTGFTNDGTRYPKSILNISRDFSAQQQVHPTQKPVPLLEWLIETYSNPGETTMDNTMGSGSTGVAAINTGRHFIGIELDPDDEGFFQIAEDRIMEAYDGKRN